MRAYYNEIDPYAAQWLRNLIAAGHISPGEVDERSILDVRPDDLVGFTRCHFFAGIGVWDYALSLAGWPKDREVWTGSCPCQPFSAAGKRGGASDERHLWPAFFHLIEQRGPATVLGEQVASKDGLDWLDLVQADLEGAGYDVGATDLCAAGVGAPHIRQRLWFMADAHGGQPWQAWGLQSGRQYGQQPTDGVVGILDKSSGIRRTWLGDESAYRQLMPADASGDSGMLADAKGARSYGGQAGAECRGLARAQICRNAGLMGHAGRQGWGEISSDSRGGGEGSEAQGLAERPLHERARGHNGGPDLTFWTDCDWIPCRDGKARPVEPGTFPLAHGAPARVGRLRAYGNAIVAEAALAFIEAVMQVRP